MLRLCVSESSPGTAVPLTAGTWCFCVPARAEVLANVEPGAVMILKMRSLIAFSSRQANKTHSLVLLLMTPKSVVKSNVSFEH